MKDYEAVLKQVAGRMMHMKQDGIQEKYPVSLLDMEAWEWPQGVGLYGLYKYYKNTGDPGTLEFLTGWYDRRMEEGPREHNINTTAPMLPLTFLYEITGRPSYLDEIKKWARWMMEDKGLIRTGDGLFQHMITGDPNEDEILIDTLFMAVYFLARAGILLHRQDYVEEAHFQILQHIKYLLNKQEGLFFHGFNFKRNDNYGEVLWGRGNCWYTIVLMDYLETVPVGEGLKRYFLSVYQNQAQALKRYADPETGLWHTVLNNPETYLELSASAGFLAGIMHGVRNGYLSCEAYGPVIEKALSHLEDYIAGDGTVLQVSYGTPVGLDEAFYKNIPCYPMTYGQAMMILALQEAMAFEGDAGRTHQMPAIH